MKMKFGKPRLFLIVSTLLVITASHTSGQQENKPCISTFCESKGTSCTKAWGLDQWNQRLDKVASHRCTLDSGNDGESLYCCDRGSPEGRTIKKYAVKPNEFPSQAFITSKYDGTSGGNCGATVYDRQWLITAAHCVVNDFGQKAHTVRVQLAVNHVKDLNNQPPKDVDQVYKATGSDIYHHNQYDRSKVLYDIAAIKLDRPIDKSVWGKTVKPLRIAKLNEVPKGDAAIAIGYGKSDLNKTLGALMGGPLPLSDPEDPDCSELLAGGKGFRVADARKKQNICVGGKGYGSVSSGDSGGPAICFDNSDRPYLCGIASWVRKDCTTQLNNQCPTLPPGGFVNVAFFNKWFTEDTIARRQVTSDLIKKLEYAPGADGSWAARVKN